MAVRNIKFWCNQIIQKLWRGCGLASELTWPLVVKLLPFLISDTAANIWQTAHSQYCIRIWVSPQLRKTYSVRGYVSMNSVAARSLHCKVRMLQKCLRLVRWNFILSIILRLHPRRIKIYQNLLQKPLILQIMLAQIQGIVEPVYSCLEWY